MFSKAHEHFPTISWLTLLRLALGVVFFLRMARKKVPGAGSADSAFRATLGFLHPGRCNIPRSVGRSGYLLPNSLGSIGLLLRISLGRVAAFWHRHPTWWSLSSSSTGMSVSLPTGYGTQKGEGYEYHHPWAIIICLGPL